MPVEVGGESVGHDFDQLQLQHSYEPDKFEYQLTRRYTPDFKVECEHPFYVEVKGWWQAEDRNKFLAVVLSNPDLSDFRGLAEAIPNDLQDKQDHLCRVVCSLGDPLDTNPTKSS